MNPLYLLVSETESFSVADSRDISVLVSFCIICSPLPSHLFNDVLNDTASTSDSSK
jgi:hypothetical protein